MVTHAHLEGSNRAVSLSGSAFSGSTLLLLVGVGIVSQIEALVLGSQEKCLEVIVEFLPGESGEDLDLLVDTIE